jgi:MFS transporter, DHA2 family, glioxin efflux transporter
MLGYLAQASPGIDTQTVLATGVSKLRQVFTSKELTAVVDGYMVGIKAVFVFAIAGAAFTTIWSLLIPFNRLPSHETKTKEDAELAGRGKEKV